MSSPRATLAHELASARKRAADSEAAPRIGRHRAEERGQPSWNNSTMVVQVLRDRLVSRGWSAGGIVELGSAVGPGVELDERPLDLGVGLWR